MQNLSFVGKSTLRIDAYGKVTGATPFSGDLTLPGMLHMKILFSMHPHARVLNIDMQEASLIPGVVAIFTARDIPVNEYGLQKNDQPVLCGPGSTRVDGDLVRFVGDQVAAIVAESEEIASLARGLIKVTYEDLPILSDPVTAMAPGALVIHPELGESNICVHDKIRKGDIDQGFALADVIVEDEYKTPVQEHAYLQPEAGLAYLDDEGRITVQAGGQWTHADREQISHSLDLPLDKIRVIYPAIGGAFGGREDMSVQIVLALAAWKLKRPVRIIWTRQESIVGHGKRHAMTLKTRWGATKAGKLVAASTEIIADAGAYMYTTNKVLGNSTITSTGPYFIPNVKTDVYGVYTNNVPGAAFRGFGAPQALFMAESQMSKLAEKLSMDPVEFRRLNALRDGDTLGVGTIVPGPVSVLQVIDAAATKFDWQPGKLSASTLTKNDAFRRGKGFACGFKNVGFSFGYKENCWARIELRGISEIEEATLWHGSAEVGQGTHTVMVQMAAEATGVTVDKIKLVASDTATSNNSGSVSASRMTFMSGNAIKGAAELALKKWDKEERPAVAEFVFYAPETTPFDKETGFSKPNFAYAYVAQAVEVEVDTETGIIRILRVVSANDVGQAINPAQVEGQIEGAVVQAQGYAISENYLSKDGRVLTDQLSTYLIPTVLDIPDKVESVIVEVPDPIGPWGARGLGELPFLPLVAAITSAVHDATGVWFNEFPLTPERVLRGLGKIS
ncbi:MAG: aldehyde oxidase [Chloroflexi bacterium GWB2_49_20]|nr:MAG: aldehyde oxidase [Chloroflexi bacterium GWB2_49_20]OGN78134.1 MAG: aldehyde oxidase [Chloroflexi bacterium GWC2_49_37]OGN85170.1 MAG: aldehyde oxidase [Chloroflexi bacterium GWD2_49_16]